MTKGEFIESIAKYAQKYAPSYGISVISPIIAQACLESAYGTSSKAAHNNFFGLKYREGRVSCHSGTFTDGSAEQNADGSYISITDSWYAFADMESGVEGYFQFINTANYANLKGVTDPETYLHRIRSDGYATSLDYVSNLMRVIRDNNLIRFDSAIQKEETTMDIDIKKGYAQTRFNVDNLSNRTIKYIVIHNTATEASAANNCQYFSTGYRGSSADFFVDRDGSIYLFNADIRNYFSWHCGDGAGRYGITNENSIGIECVSAGTEFSEEQKKALKKLIAYLEKEYNIEYRAVRHYDASRKTCPMAYSGTAEKTAKWNELLDYLYAEENEVVVEEPKKQVLIDSVKNAIYRMYNPNTGKHFFTENCVEAQALVDTGWNYEGIAFLCAESGANIYRLYSKQSGDHLYTKSASEKKHLVALGWIDEGIAWKAPKEGVSVYRLYSPGEHFFTASKAERDALVNIGWINEGIAFFSVE